MEQMRRTSRDPPSSGAASPTSDVTRRLGSSVKAADGLGTRTTPAASARPSCAADASRYRRRINGVSVRTSTSKAFQVRQLCRGAMPSSAACQAKLGHDVRKVMWRCMTPFVCGVWRCKQFGGAGVTPGVVGGDRFDGCGDYKWRQRLCKALTMLTLLCHCYHMTVQLIKHPVPDRIKPSFIIFDIRALWRSAVSVRVPGCQKLQMTASFLTSGHSDNQPWASECPDVKNYKWRLNRVWHRMLYSCTHMATVGIRKLNADRTANFLSCGPPEKCPIGQSLTLVSVGLNVRIWV